MNEARPRGVAATLKPCCTRSLVALALASVLVGCATLPPPPASALSGRIAVRVDAHGEQPARGFSAGFDLQGGAGAGELRLASPLGTLLASARWSGAGAWLVTPEGETAYADLDALSRAALGEVLPLRALPDWLHGRPWDGAPSRRVETGFEQLGWRIALAGLAAGRVEAVRLDPLPAVTVRAALERP